MGKKSSFLKTYLTNQLRVAEFALNNICTAKCQFCSIWKQKKKYNVDTAKALIAVSKLKSFGVRFITITGGEPLLHPHFAEIANHCTKENITTTTITADPRILNDKRIHILKQAEIDCMGISIDHHTDEVTYKARKIPHLIDGIKQAVKKLKENDILVTASILISDFNHSSLPTLFKKCEKLGFDSISLSYPVFSPSPTYTLGGDAIKLSRKDLITALKKVLRLKAEYDIVNPRHSIENIITYLRGENPRFPCLGGYRSFFVDWTFQVYPCMCHEKSMGNILTMNKNEIKKTSCNLCNMSWYRDFSIFFQGFKSLPPLFQELKRIIAF
ncbi:MAG: radical SAM protein [Spirochaetales bacterium]|nr:radical SAM protein [Spirochaetales bacterium]